MFGFISNFFSGRASTPAEAPQLAAAPKPDATTIAYDPNLISALEADHSQLVNLYGKIWDDGFETKNYAKVARYLSEFKSLFQGHLLKENVRFYVYLEQTLGKDKHTLAVVKEFRTDMNDIATTVISFCKRYGKTSWTPPWNFNSRRNTCWWEKR